jgi:hypothetical protein
MIVEQLTVRNMENRENLGYLKDRKKDGGKNIIVQEKQPPVWLGSNPKNPN